jgi:F-type H+-transporting ATPase subunit b
MFEIQSALIFWTSISFGILVVLLYRFALPPLIGFLEKREQMIADSISAAQENQKRSEDTLLENKKQLTLAQRQAERLLASAKEEGERLKGEVLERAENHARFVLEQARLDLVHEREKILDGVKKETVGLVAAAASKLLRRSINPQDNQRIIEESLKEAQG